MMKPAAAKAYVRQLCSLGLGGPAILPELLRALAAVIPSGPNVFMGLSPDYEISYAIVENPVPELVELFVQEIHGAFRREMETQRDWWRHHPASVVCSYVQAAYGDIYRSDFYHHIWRPLNQHHVLDGLVSERGQPLGTVHLFRAQSEQPFSERDAAELACLLPHIAHGMTARADQNDAWVDSGRRGHAILDGSGRLTHQSDAARQLLCLATHSRVDAVRPPGSLPLPALFQKLAENVSAIARGREAPPAAVCRQNHWGQFVFRAYRLNDTTDLHTALTLVTIEHQEPLQLRLMRGLRTLSLSTKEREVCLWLAQGQSIAEVAGRLDLRHGTAKKYADSAYLKLDIHNRAELVQKIMSEAGRSHT